MTENTENLRGKVLSGLFWKALENGGVQLVQLVISLILARLLGPERYGQNSPFFWFLLPLQMCLSRPVFRHP